MENKRNILGFIKESLFSFVWFVLSMQILSIFNVVYSGHFNRSDIIHLLLVGFMYIILYFIWKNEPFRQLTHKNHNSEEKNYE